MPGHIDLRSATAELRALVERARDGEEIVFTEDGELVAKLGPADHPSHPVAWEDLSREEKARRRKELVGRFAGQVDVDAFDAPLPDDILDAMNDPKIFPTDP
ncbi:hypothetical protein HHL28_00575 [Aerophototrophica crusticola]|uniref:Prevent-host-death protein n=1 Tax=Aerophototrophica crusticola TaxID=1709002 RepID=A0A858R3Y3_9PROT|nr:hypothetical protein HHL28_00575 [Rhodospirillaceae bacterium B3]